MTAIAKLENNLITEFKFSTNIAEVNPDNVHIVNVNEPAVTATEVNKESIRASIRRPINNPFGLSILNKVTIDIGDTAFLPITEANDTARDNPYCRQLSASAKESISVRPAAERSGQTSFFGNL